MAEILTSKEILGALDNIIKGADKFVCIFTFNVSIDQAYLSRLRNASKRGVKITVAFGVDNGNEEVINPLLEIPNTRVYFKRYLHAKFFYNEKELLIGSMNLSEVSGRNNFELGVLFKGIEYQEAIKKVKFEAKEIIDDSIEWSQLIKKGQPKLLTKTEQRTGMCIRCQEKIKFDPFNPLCPACLSVWSEWENSYYLESYCHGCGRPRDGISKALPQCKPCYNKFIANLNSPTKAPEVTLVVGQSDTLDSSLKEIISKNLKIDRTLITIDMSLGTVFNAYNDQRSKMLLSDIEQRFEIRLKKTTHIKDYWDLYKAIAMSLSPKSNVFTGLK
ncbi:MAG: phospholipase D-like domain-containing protein [Cyclobacteriaceae bacterium]